MKARGISSAKKTKDITQSENVASLATMITDIVTHRPATTLFLTPSVISIGNVGYSFERLNKTIQPFLSDKKFIDDLAKYGLFNEQDFKQNITHSLSKHRLIVESTAKTPPLVDEIIAHLLAKDDLQKVRIVGGSPCFLLRKREQSTDNFLLERSGFIKYLNLLITNIIYPGKATPEMVNLVTNDEAMGL